MSGNDKSDVDRVEESVDALGSRLPDLRDRFAMAALAGMLADSGTNPTRSELPAFVANAYEIADAMLDAREQRSDRERRLALARAAELWAAGDYSDQDLRAIVGK